MGIELARAFVKVRGDASELANDLSGVAGMVQDALSDARVYAAGFLGKIAQMGESFLTVGRKMRDSNEETRINFETLIGSVAETDSLLRKLTNFAVKTPFEMPQLLSVTQELLTFGERGEELMGTIKMLGDASQGNAGKFATLGLVFNQMRAIGKFSTQSQDFRQLSSRGIISLKDMAQYLKKTDAEVSKMQISFEDVRGALKMLTAEGGRFYNAMEKQSNSMIGLTSTLNDAWNIMARGVAEVLGPIEKLTLKIKIGLVEAMQSAVQATDGLVAGAAVGSIKLAKLASVFLVLRTAAQYFGVTWTTLFKGTGIGAVILLIGAAIGTLTTYFFKSAAGIEMVNRVSKDLGIVWMNLKAAGVVLIDALGEIFETFTGSTFSDFMENWSKGVASITTSFSGWLVEMSKALMPFVEVIAFALRNIKELFAITGINIAISFISAFQTIEEMNNKLWNNIMRVMSGMTAFVKALVHNIVQPFKGLGLILAAEGVAAFEGFRAALNGGSMKDIQEAMNESVKKSISGTELDKNLDKKISEAKEVVEHQKRMAAANTSEKTLEQAQKARDAAKKVNDDAFRDSEAAAEKRNKIYAEYTALPLGHENKQKKGEEYDAALAEYKVASNTLTAAADHYEATIKEFDAAEKANVVNPFANDLATAKRNAEEIQGQIDNTEDPVAKAAYQGALAANAQYLEQVQDQNDKWEAENPGKENPFAKKVKQAEEDLAALEATKKSMESQDPFKAYQESYDAYQESGITTPIGGETKEELEAMKKAYLDMIAERELLRKKAAGEELTPEEAAKGKEAAKPETPIIETGRYGFAQFGTKLQDAILKGKGADQQQKMVDLMGQGNSIQQKILDEQKNNKPGLGP